MESELLSSWPLPTAIALTVIVASVTHGTFGFGFPAISMPILVLLTDVKTAIIINILPNLTVNFIGIVSGGNWSASLGRHWRIAAYVVIGSYAGTQFLIVAPSDPLRLLLALMIFAYLYQNRLARLDWSWLMRHPRASEFSFGVVAGFFSGTVNLSYPPLLIYFMLLGLQVTAVVQILNLSFFGGRMTQAATLGFAGEIGGGILLLTLPLALIATAGMYVGHTLQRRFSREAYQRILHKVLFVIAIVLVWQGASYFAR